VAGGHAQRGWMVAAAVIGAVEKSALRVAARLWLPTCVAPAFRADGTGHLDSGGGDRQRNRLGAVARSGVWDLSMRLPHRGY
jgi:hypothetical protein